MPQTKRSRSQMENASASTSADEEVVWIDARKLEVVLFAGRGSDQHDQPFFTGYMQVPIEDMKLLVSQFINQDQIPVSCGETVKDVTTYSSRGADPKYDRPGCVRVNERIPRIQVGEIDNIFIGKAACQLMVSVRLSAKARNLNYTFTAPTKDIVWVAKKTGEDEVNALIDKAILLNGIEHSTGSP